MTIIYLSEKFCLVGLFLSSTKPKTIYVQCRQFCTGKVFLKNRKKISAHFFETTCWQDFCNFLRKILIGTYFEKICWNLQKIIKFCQKLVTQECKMKLDFVYIHTKLQLLIMASLGFFHKL
jgi:hypothetical protein